MVMLYERIWANNAFAGDATGRRGKLVAISRRFVAAALCRP